MEAQQQQQQGNEDGGSHKSSSGSSYLCRQSSTRWTPTSDQIRILKDLYYNNGVRSPSAEQIQRISARLRQYGKIEGKNVFYWFQNHKARERQKKRFTNDINIPSIQRQGTAVLNNTPWKSDHHNHHHHHHQDLFIYNKYPAASVNPSPPPPATAGASNVVAVGQVGISYGYGSVAMERSFRDCSISQVGVGVGGGGGGGSMAGHNFGWVGMETCPSVYPFLEGRKLSGGYENETQQEEDGDEDEGEDEDQTPEIETLPLFPMHGEFFCSILKQHDEDDNNNNNRSNILGGYYNNTTQSWCHRSDDDQTRGASLELSLTSSYAGMSPETLF